MVIKGRTLKLIKDAYRILQNSRPMTQSQIYTRLIKRGSLSNTLEGPKILTDALVRARQEGLIPWDWIKEEDWAKEEDWIKEEEEEDDDDDWIKEEDLIREKEDLIREKEDLIKEKT